MITYFAKPMTIAAAVIFALVAILAPGVALQRALRLKIDPSLVIPIGLVFCSAAYRLSLVTDVSWLFPLLAIVCGALLFVPGVRIRLADGPSLRGSVAPFLAAVILFSVTQYPINRFDGHGRFLHDPADSVDTAFHVGVTWELVRGYPPQIPGLAGAPLSYHVGAYLARAACVRWTGLHPYDAMYRFDITLWGLALILVLRRTAQVLGVPPLSVEIAGWIPLLTELSFLLAPLTEARWWAARLYGNLVEGLFFANSMIPAMAIALGAVAAWARHRAGEGRGWLALAIVLGAAVPYFKIFFAPAFLLGLGMAWLRDRESRPALLWMIALTFIATIVATLGIGGGETRFAVRLFDLARRSRTDLDLAPLTGVRFLAWALFWNVASLGLRVFGFLPAFASLRGRRGPQAALAAIALTGWPMAAFFYLSADKQHSEAAYFMEQSGPLLWLFALPVVVRFVTRSRHRTLRSALCLLCCLPSTVEYVHRKASVEPDVFSPALVTAMRTLEIVSQPDEVILMRPETVLPPPPLVLIGRKIPMTTYFRYQMQFAKQDVLHRNDRLTRRFFRSREPERAIAIARELKARFLYLTGQQQMLFDATRAFELIYDSQGERVYRIY